MKLTKTSVEKLEGTGKRYNQFDDDLKGFAVRVGVGGDKSFYYVYRAGKGRGAPLKWLRLGAFPAITIEQARSLAKVKAAAVTFGEDPATLVQEEKTALSVADALDAFSQEYVEKLKPSTIAFYRIVIDKHLKMKLGRIRAKDLGYPEIARFHSALKNKPYMANRCIAVLSVFLNWCEKHGYRERHSNPCKEIPLYRELKRQDFMSADDLSILGDALARMEAAGHERREAGTTASITPQAAAAIRLLMFTGARLSEILSLKWSYIDLEQGIARLPDSKTGFKVLQLPAPALAVLESLPKVSEWVLPADSRSGHTVSLKNAWKKVLEFSGLGRWRLHDLRHSFASVMVNSGASLPIIGKILGHSQVSTTQRYAHLEKNPARKAAEDAAAKIAEALKTAPKRGKVLSFRKVGEDGAR
jgi:integrase